MNEISTTTTTTTAPTPNARPRQTLTAAREKIDRFAAADERRRLQWALDAQGNTPAHFAAQDGKVRSLCVLLDVGGIHVDARGSQGQTVTHRAAGSNSAATLRACLERGGNLGIKDNFGYTPVHLAALAGASRTLHVAFAEGGANPNAGGLCGRSATHCAVGSYSVDAVLTCLRHGGTAHARDAEGDTPCDDAIWLGRPDCVRALLQHGGRNGVRLGLNPMFWTGQGAGIPLECLFVTAQFIRRQQGGRRRQPSMRVWDE
jgi:ankyrin repeat protein